MTYFIKKHQLSLLISLILNPNFYKGVIHIPNLTLNFSAKLRGL
jgi:hypothetical protein